MPDDGSTRARYRRILRFAARHLLVMWWFELVLPRFGLAGLAARGRSARLTRLARRFHVLAVDLGVTSVDVAVSDLSAQILATAGHPIDIGDGPGPVLAEVDRLARQVLEGVQAGEGSPDEVIAARGLAVVSDDSSLQKAIDDALAAQPGVADKIRSGKVQAVGAIVGAVMKATRGQADAGRVRELVLSTLGVQG